MSINITSIMELIPAEELVGIGEELGIDKKNSKITGAFILKSFIRCSLLGRPISLRSIESMCNNTSGLNSLLYQITFIAINYKKFQTHRTQVVIYIPCGSLHFL